MKKNIKKLCASALSVAVIAASSLTGFAVSAAETNTGVDLHENGLSQTVEGGAILHCWCWNFNTIREKLPEIAAAGFSAIQTSPICEVNKVAVVYRSNIAEEDKETFEPAVNLSPASGYFLTEALNVDVTVRSCDHAEYTLTVGDSTTTGSVVAGDTIVIENLANNQTATLTLTGYDAENNELSSVTREYTRWIKQDNTIVYMEPEARESWKQCYVYIWGSAENASWPGVKMELTEQGLYKYILPYQYEMAGSNGNVIFNNRNVCSSY